MKRAITNSYEQRLANAQAELKCQCAICGRKEIIPAWKDSTLCTHCGNRIKNNTKARFKYVLRRTIEDVSKNR